MGAIVLLGVGGLLAAAGLWRRARWARPLAIVVAALNVVSALPGVTSAPTTELAAGAGATIVGLAVVVALLLLPASQDAYVVLARLDRRLALAIPPESVLPTIVETVATALALPYVAITLVSRESPAPTVVTSGAAPAGAVAPAATARVPSRAPEARACDVSWERCALPAGEPRLPEARIVASYGSPVPTVLHLPLRYGAEIVGHLHLAPPAGARTFCAADRRLLADLAAHAGVVVHAARLTTDLQGSRERLVTAREEERRRLRRDLHDELAPTLAALALTAGTAQDVMATDPATAQSLIGTLHDALRGSVGQVRRLVDDLRPPTLDELGLEAAIRERSAQVNGQDASGCPQVVVEAPALLPPLPAAVEVAAYRIVQEALMNVVKHAQAQRCTIRLTVQDGPAALQVTITDDRVGLPAAPRRGVGLGSMRERAAELGGACVVESAPSGGTRVIASLPLLALGTGESA